ncbi:galactokinase [Thalassotalea insulae]|uniref:Galactokinase n=1 Tax=Thalassotalea insulae TaxID=2056778 RepID=A0ABQ6GRM6_9GAMM|nr:galactokinase [Thalassotalea insulae]GLX78566.1 galactokinase [Thalassotalea insulae]
MDLAYYVKHKFIDCFAQQPDIITHAPGRVNLIGDHTDYNDGFVLPAAINFATYIAARQRNDNKIRVLALDYQQPLMEFELNHIQFNHKNMWLNYVSGTLQALMAQFPNISGADIAVTGSVPQGAGLSSSASFEIAILKAFAQLNNLPLTGVQAALIGQKAENDFVGCNCGIMDQLISALGKENQAMLLDCRDMSMQYATIPKDMALLIINSNVKRGLVDSEYNLRRSQCEQVARYFNQPSLRSVSLNMLKQAENKLDPILIQRAKHVITENTRTEAAMKALEQHDIKALSYLMADSHLSLKQDFAITTAEIDFLVELIAKALGTQGGVRMTGGGFGGCVIALTPKSKVEEITQLINDNYQKSTGLNATIYLCEASDGAFNNTLPNDNNNGE